ncbi:hypothetical protein BDN67DRAFT_158486 [Paxillus ammoniavirescens]|nr:hypothetical protein BDN67DRAFT_158486 [Paxillus ammoniavirescens]
MSDSSRADHGPMFCGHHPILLSVILLLLTFLRSILGWITHAFFFSSFRWTDPPLPSYVLFFVILRHGRPTRSFLHTDLTIFVFERFSCKILDRNEWVGIVDHGDVLTS